MRCYTDGGPSAQGVHLSSDTGNLTNNYTAPSYKQIRRSRYYSWNMPHGFHISCTRLSMSNGYCIGVVYISQLQLAN